MKKHLIALLAAAAAFVSFADGVVVTNELLLIDQNGNPSVPGVLGTASEMARLQAEMRIAAAEAANAEAVYAQTTNLLEDVAKQLVNRNAVVYRKYFMDAFTAALIIGDDDKCVITGWEKLPDAQQDDPARVKYYCHYACTADILALKGIFKTNSDLTVDRKEWEYLDESYVTDLITDPARSSYTDKDGNLYEHCYRATVSIPAEAAHFLVINIKNQSADTDGATVLIYGGAAGGINAVIPSGSLGYTITGGYVTGVTEAN